MDWSSHFFIESILSEVNCLNERIVYYLDDSFLLAGEVLFHSFLRNYQLTLALGTISSTERTGCSICTWLGSIHSRSGIFLSPSLRVSHWWLFQSAFVNSSISPSSLIKDTLGTWAVLHDDLNVSLLHLTNHAGSFLGGTMLGLKSVHVLLSIILDFQNPKTLVQSSDFRKHQHSDRNNSIIQFVQHDVLSS